MPLAGVLRVEEPAPRDPSDLDQIREHRKANTPIAQQSLSEFIIVFEGALRGERTLRMRNGPTHKTLGKFYLSGAGQFTGEPNYSTGCNLRYIILQAQPGATHTTMAITERDWLRDPEDGEKDYTRPRILRHQDRSARPRRGP